MSLKIRLALHALLKKGTFVRDDPNYRTVTVSTFEGKLKRVCRTLRDTFCSSSYEEVLRGFLLLHKVMREGNFKVFSFFSETRLCHPKKLSSQPTQTILPEYFSFIEKYGKSLESNILFHTTFVYVGGDFSIAPILPITETLKEKMDLCELGKRVMELFKENCKLLWALSEMKGFDEMISMACQLIFNDVIGQFEILRDLCNVSRYEEKMKIKFERLYVEVKKAQKFVLEIGGKFKNSAMKMDLPNTKKCEEIVYSTGSNEAKIFCAKFGIDESSIKNLSEVEDDEIEGKYSPYDNCALVIWPKQ
ncbi:hypothetical protein EIN_486880 [Entamoeba invadens IP1]|uniref:ENTH domain-containing protein n=1 Tax=Entamoeba invadens IP1 TaxID=370355 RepID=A0A0A1U4R5_ENTIV|nr:hypothetical protein EIN_486880 [Entamoeba invadens IP1]ELP89226.1 hypothetical protein EIN_486880 [Entamoeba invadens IP1]|eukprot:XP_004255997.1 hypothetical protein EIN_486880 [Entamoeba invadens IP1]